MTDWLSNNELMEIKITVNNVKIKISESSKSPFYKQINKRVQKRPKSMVINLTYILSIYLFFVLSFFHGDK